MPPTRSCARCGATAQGDDAFCTVCGAQVSGGHELAARRVAKFELGAVIGRGGMGVVHRARDPVLGRDVALKLIAPQVASDYAFRARFQAEARAAAAVDHPNVLPVFEAGEEDGELYIATRLVEGTDLGVVLSRELRLRPARAARIVKQIAAGLDAAHARNLVHRDVKPANVLLEGRAGEEHVYLTDFGLTQRVGGELEITVPGRVAGTANYMAPEQVSGEQIDGRVDVYALACVAFECLAGYPPFRRDSPTATLYAHTHDEIPSAARAVPGLSSEVDEVLAVGLAKDPRERFGACGALARALTEAVGLDPGEEVSNPRVAAAARPQPLTRPAARPRPAAPHAPGRPPFAPAPVPQAPKSLGIGPNLAIGALALVAVLAAAAAFVFSREDGAQSEERAAIPLIDAAQAINQNMTTMATRLARAPADEAERQAQVARLPDLRGELQGISRAARRFDGEAAALLRDALGEQREVLDVYRATLNEPASPPPSSLKRRLREIATALHDSRRAARR